MHHKYQLFLGSSSPRRKTLLAQLGLDFRIHASSINERILNGEKPMSYVKRMAAWKALTAFKEINEADALIISADTSVIIDNRILGKPLDFEDFLQTMKILAGRTHQVYTAVCITDGKNKEDVVSISDVSFKELELSEIKAYWDCGEPLDKAGGYGIQGLGSLFISQITGSYSGIMGLPLYETAAMLKKFGINPLPP
ncbi:septum formation inhibitor [Gammaproteobacteria bacterium]|nr:septum formation inhibitor [Gammaproteobacteria bacterium]